MPAPKHARLQPGWAHGPCSLRKTQTQLVKSDHFSPVEPKEKRAGSGANSSMLG